MTTAQTVDRLIQDMKRAAINRDMRDYDRKSDELAVLVRAYAEPTINSPWPRGLFTPQESRIVDILFSRLGKLTTSNAIIEAMYFDRPEGGPDDAESGVKVQISRIRKKLVGKGYRIETHWGQGFEMLKGETEHRTTYVYMKGAHRHRPARQAA